MYNRRIIARRKIGGGAAMTRWFEQRRFEMTGVCRHCGGVSSAYSDLYYKFSIAHILPKAYFPSVKTHALNWIELCHFGKSCHTNLDNHYIDLIDLNCWDEVVEKFLGIYPSIAFKERRRIPDVLMQFVKNERDI